VKKKVFLVTTALEETWKSNKPVLFLGTWCLRYQRKEVWDIINGELLAFHWADYIKLKNDYDYLNRLDAQLISELTIWLNKYHGVKHSNKYWQILVGPWLTYFLHIVFERWESIRIANEQYDITGTTIIRYNDLDNFPKDMFEFALCMGTDQWNHYLLSEACEFFIAKEKITYIDYTKNIINFKQMSNQSNFSLTGKMAKLLLKIYKKITTKFTKNNTYFIGSTYMGLWKETLLNLKLGQLPIFYELIFPTKTNPDANLRKIAKFEYHSESQFEEFFVGLIIKQIPSCFLEGYKSLIKEVENLPLPKDPKLIFTSNFLAFDSLMMAYTSRHVDSGAKLVHGQHGGYGIPAFMSAFDHEKNISNRFISWGRIQEEIENMVPIGILKPVNQYKIKGSPNNNCTLLLIRGLWPRYTFRLDSGSGLNLNDSIDNCMQFADLLSKDIREGPLLVRLYPSDHGFGEEDRWRDHFPEIRLDRNASISKLVSGSRLVIYSYNLGTGYLEFLCANVPTIAFWNMNTSPISELAVPYFEELKRVGVFHDTPESLAAHIHTVWDDVESWWQSANVQNATKKFCEKFAFVADNLVDRVESVLRKEITNN